MVTLHAKVEPAVTEVPEVGHWTDMLTWPAEEVEVVEVFEDVEVVELDVEDGDVEEVVDTPDVEWLDEVVVEVVPGEAVPPPEGLKPEAKK